MQAETKRKRILAICCGAHGVQDGLSAALYVLMPVLAQAFGLSYAQIGIIRATNNTAMALFEMPSGLLSEWFGERRLLVFGLVCAGFGYVYLATASSLWIILVSLLIAGTGAAFQHALASSIISRTFESGGRRSALGLYNSSGDAGKLVFTGLFSLALGVGMAWQGVVAGFGLVALVFAVAVYLVLRSAHAGARRSVSEDPATDSEPAGWGIRDRTGFSALCLVVFLDTAVQAGFLVFVAFVVTAKDVPADLAGFAVVVTLIGGMFGKAGCGYLADRIGIRNAFALAQCATAAGIVVFLLVPPLPAFFVLPFVGVFLQGSTSITYGTVADFVRSNRQSRGFAMIYSVSGLSAIAGPVGFGLLSDHSGLSTTMCLPWPSCPSWR